MVVSGGRPGLPEGGGTAEQPGAHPSIGACILVSNALPAQTPSPEMPAPSAWWDTESSQRIRHWRWGKLKQADGGKMFWRQFAPGSQGSHGILGATSQLWKGS
jgi:N-methylhydantoinase B/oxoprolinase/acetone carboxylase alpha subunit